MSTHRVRQTQTTEWQNLVVSSAAAFSISTDDPSLSVVSAPMPTLQFDLGGKTKTRFAVMRPMAPVPAAVTSPQPAGQMQAASMPEPEEQPVDAAPVAKAEVQSEEGSKQVEQIPEPEEPPVVDTPIAKMEGRADQVELIIDSLTRHTLIEPIPVVIESLGDTVFTAAMRNCDIQATGNSVGEALLILKEQIESDYDSLNRQLQHLDSEQRTRLQTLHIYVAPPPEKSGGWFGRR
jgi:hypothetical protein